MNTSRTRTKSSILPWHQQLIMKVYLAPIVAGESNSAKNRQAYETFSAKIIKLVQDIPFSMHRVPVLVPAQVGLFDNTRYWSIAMTLEHLLKVDRRAKQIILSLAHGHEPIVTVNIQNTQPEGLLDPAHVFTEYCESIGQNLDEIDAAFALETDKELKAPHPVFGPITAKQWHWSMAARTSLRYRQIKNIVKGLAPNLAAGPLS